MRLSIAPFLLLILALILGYWVLLGILAAVSRRPKPRPAPKGEGRTVNPSKAAEAAEAAGTAGTPHSRKGWGAMRALRLIMSAPAFLVPAVLASLMAVFSVWMFGVGSSENPFGVGSRPLLNGDQPLNWLLFFAMSLLLAGQIGLLTAAYSGRRASGLHFWLGIKQHGLTMLAAKLLLFFCISVISGVVDDQRPYTLMLYVVPSLLLAPVLGTSALHPGQPMQALKAALVRSSSDVAGTGKLVALQLLLLLGAWVVYSKGHQGAVSSQGELLPIQLLGQGSSVLSYNLFPMLSLIPDSISLHTILCTVFSVICSTAFLGAHFLKVMDETTELEKGRGMGKDGAAEHQRANQST